MNSENQKSASVSTSTYLNGKEAIVFTDAVCTIPLPNQDYVADIG